VAEVQVKGLDDLKRAVEELTADLRRKVVIGALRDAARPIVAAARANAPILRTPDARRTAGLVRRNIATFTSKRFKGQGGVIGVYISVRKNKGRRIKGTRVRVKALQSDPFYWKFLELGTRFMPAMPFLRPAAEAGWQGAIDIFKQRIAERIRKANTRTR
jgi:HK97 gp10 family phage protein